MANQLLTKPTVLKTFARMYRPLRYLVPFVLRAKLAVSKNMLIHGQDEGLPNGVETLNCLPFQCLSCRALIFIVHLLFALLAVTVHPILPAQKSVLQLLSAH